MELIGPDSTGKIIDCYLKNHPSDNLVLQYLIMNV